MGGPVNPRVGAFRHNWVPGQSLGLDGLVTYPLRAITGWIDHLIGIRELHPFLFQNSLSDDFYFLSKTVLLTSSDSFGYAVDANFQLAVKTTGFPVVSYLLRRHNLAQWPVEQHS